MLLEVAGGCWRLLQVVLDVTGGCWRLLLLLLLLLPILLLPIVLRLFAACAHGAESASHLGWRKVIGPASLVTTRILHPPSHAA